MSSLWLKVTTRVLLLLAIVGAVNWGLVGIWKYDLVAKIFGDSFGTLSSGSRAVYIVVGAAGLALIPQLFMGRREESASSSLTGLRDTDELRTQRVRKAA